MFLKVTYALYPNATQEAALLDMKGSHQRLHNAALEQRISAWQRCGISVKFTDQCKDLTALRAADPEYKALNAQSSQVTLKRVDLAMQSFFRRVKSGETPGFPRFKSFDRFSGWGYKTHGDGWRLTPGEGFRHGRLRLSGIGNLRIRGKARLKGEPVTCEISHKAGRWQASVTLEVRPNRECGSGAAGMDWGVETFATLVHADGRVQEIPNPRWVKRAEVDLAEAQRVLSRRKGPVGRKPSKRWLKAKARVTRIQRKTTNQRLNFLHQESTKLVKALGFIATETLNVKAMTASAKRTVEEPGKNVQKKAGLNRSILDTAPAAFLSITKAKAEEAMAEWVDVPTKTVKPTQTCRKCGHQRKKTLKERLHVCKECGHTEKRDVNAAWVMLNWALWGHVTGRVLARQREAASAVPSCETPSIPQGWVE
jgi:putative transposase